MSIFYNGSKLLSMKDLDGLPPELYLCTGNRSAGKTTYFSKLIVDRFLKSGEKFMLLYRFNYEITDVADKFFKDIGGLFFNDYYFTAERRASGIYYELYINRRDGNDSTRQHCGYAVALNNSDQLRKYSHLFSDTEQMFFDEFQSESDHYCTNEINKFLSLHTSVARGQGQQTRRVPVYMCSNAVSMLNPYFAALGISSRLQANTKFLRGHGFVLECSNVESAADALRQSRFMTAFSANSDYLKYATENIYLNDSLTFIEKPSGRSKYLATLEYQGKGYALRSFPDDGIIYCDDRPDRTAKFCIAVTTADHRINYVILRQNNIFVEEMRFLFERGSFRFKNLSCKEAALVLLSYQ